jgi:hypothetical protein
MILVVTGLLSMTRLHRVMRFPLLRFPFIRSAGS